MDTSKIDFHTSTYYTREDVIDFFGVDIVTQVEEEIPEPTSRVIPPNSIHAGQLEFVSSVLLDEEEHLYLAAYYYLDRDEDWDEVIGNFDAEPDHYEVI